MPRVSAARRQVRHERQTRPRGADGRHEVPRRSGSALRVRLLQVYSAVVGRLGLRPGPAAAATSAAASGSRPG